MEVVNPISISIVPEEPPVVEPPPEESSASDDSIQVDEVRMLNIPVIDWCKTMLYKKWKETGSSEFKGQHEEIEETLFFTSLEELMQAYEVVREGYRQERLLAKADEEYRPYHYKSYLTFTKLLLEQGFPQDFINQITSKYTNSSVLETLKLMIRSKRLFKARPKILDIIASFQTLESEFEKFKLIVEKHDSF